MKKLAIASITALSLAALGSAASAQVATGTVTGPSGNPNFPFQVTTPNGAVFFCSSPAGAVTCINPAALAAGAGAGAGLGAGFGGLGLSAAFGGLIILAVVAGAIGDTTSGTNN